MLDVIEGTAFEVLYQMRRNLKHPADFLHIEFSCGQKLRILRRQGDWLILHTFFEDCDAVCVPCAAVCLCPVVADLLRILQYARMLQHTGRLRSVFEEGAAVSLYCHDRTECIFHHRYR